ncbi:MAG: trypsin-like peptidase domain-containing protein [Candidatus Cryptobacteroides sp.]|nr:trypsin-like peptidase domain-containing protein [Candidatus Cryptobacteroides sp.]
MKKGILYFFIAAIAGAISACAVVKLSNRNSTAADSSAVVQSDTQFRTVDLSNDKWPDFTFAAETCVDAVVYVKVRATQQVVSNAGPLFRFFFGYERIPFSRDVQGSGSGVIIREDGYIVTNNHVIAGANAIEVTLNNNRTYPARLIGTDPATDVALIKIEESGLPIVPFADSDQLRLGEWVLAIGSPYDLRSTITAGIVSAKGRSMPKDPNNPNEFRIESFIQTDAAVNPGNSGGALVNKEGKLVGVNTAIISQTGSYAGYSFAVPSNIVKRITDDLMDYGTVHRARLGIVMLPINDEIAKELKLSSVNGVYITDMASDSAAAEAGIKVGDVVVEIGGSKVTGVSSVQELVNNFHPGDRAEVKVIRGGEALSFEVVLK